ncbi:MAG: hypothetical protein WDN02_02855 [Methylovirgula sp.]|uniref:hypothetical protein n=1 Tax=Methylovirgula sp. TaxID=1978224 RepID=UPI0030761149
MSQWQEIVAQKEIIINAIDLVSFLLVTPEVVRLTAPFLSQAVLIFLVVFIVLPVAGVIGQFFFFEVLSSLDLAFAVGLYLGYLIIIIIFFFRNRRPLYDWLSKHALLVGVLLFGTNRMFALVIAIQEWFKHQH